MYSLLYINGDARFIQYIFQLEPMKTTTKYYPAVGISRQKMDEARSWQQDLLLFCTDIDLVVTN